MYSGVCFGVQLGAGGKGCSSAAADSGPALSGIRQRSAGAAPQVDPGPRALKPLQDQALTTPRHLPLSRGRPARCEGRRGLSRAVAPPGHGRSPRHRSVPGCSGSLPALVVLRNEKGKSISSEYLKAQRPTSLSPPRASWPGFGFHVGLRLLFHLTLLERAAEGEFGVREAGARRQVRHCSGRRGADSSSRVSVIPGTDPAPPPPAQTLWAHPIWAFLWAGRTWPLYIMWDKAGTAAVHPKIWRGIKRRRSFVHRVPRGAAPPAARGRGQEWGCFSRGGAELGENLRCSTTRGRCSVQSHRLVPLAETQVPGGRNVPHPMADATPSSGLGLGGWGTVPDGKPSPAPRFFAPCSSKGWQVSVGAGFPLQPRFHPFHRLRLSRMWSNRESRSFVRRFGQRPPTPTGASAEKASGWREKRFPAAARPRGDRREDAKRRPSGGGRDAQRARRGELMLRIPPALISRGPGLKTPKRHHHAPRHPAWERRGEPAQALPRSGNLLLPPDYL